MQEAYADQYRDLEECHWWFRARRLILRERLHALDLPPHPSFLEIGVGSGTNLYSIYPEGSRLVGVEPDGHLVALARARGSVPVHEAAVEALPPEVSRSRFDVVTMFDCLEHTEDESLVLGKVRELLVPGGHLVVTVPAYQSLWSPHDVVNRHYRRYTRKQLVSKVDEAGFTAMRATYFCTLLFPPVAALRILRRLMARPDDQPTTDMTYSLGSFDHVLYRVFLMERGLLRWVDLPYGTSVLLVARTR